MTTVERSFELAQEVLADGFTCDDALAEWMARMQVEGLRYCPLAAEQILLSCIDEDEEEEPLDIPEDEEVDFDEDLDESALIIPGLDEEPTPEELAAEQGRLPPPPPSGGLDVHVVRFSYQSAPPGQRDASTLHEGELFRGDQYGARAAYDAAVAFDWPTEFALYRLEDGFKIDSKIVNP